ncbi:hypothetical protein GCM10007981_10640 [Thermocladium modestius]|uniref:Uncharacterized protein n=1 Tax=Thermocladium modestius TaxID=62609 RepID=A0A830GVD1_9CREN|nr:hypothetical protein GCM10007981_10640 [Thermocladium modestius]
MVPLILAALVILTAIATIHALRDGSAGPRSSISLSQPQPRLSLPAYVVGPPSLVEDIKSSLPGAEPIPLNSIGSIPAGSVVVIDWGYLMRELGNNASEAARYLAPLLEREVFVEVRVNSSQALPVEVELAYLWAKARGAPAAIPMDLHGAGGGYVVAAPVGSRVLMIAETGGEGVMERLGLWSSIIDRASVDSVGGLQLEPAIAQLQSSGGNDVCYDIGTSTGFSGVENGYLYWTGPGFGSDGNGTFTVDYCIEMANYIRGTINGIPYVPAWIYNFVEYRPSSTLINNSGYIMTGGSYQDSYASYECYVNPNYQAPDGYCRLARVDMGFMPAPYGWWPSYSLGSSSTTTSYGLNFAVGFSGSGASGSFGGSITESTTVSIPQVAISVYAPETTGGPLGGAANFTWIFKPNENVGAGQQVNAYMSSSDEPLAVPEGNSTIQEIDIPTGSWMRIYTGQSYYGDAFGGCLYNDYEFWGSRIEWVVLWPNPPYWAGFYQLINQISAAPLKGIQYYDSGTIFMNSTSTIDYCVANAGP